MARFSGKKISKVNDRVQSAVWFSTEGEGSGRAVEAVSYVHWNHLLMNLRRVVCEVDDLADGSALGSWTSVAGSLQAVLSSVVYYYSTLNQRDSERLSGSYQAAVGLAEETARRVLRHVQENYSGDYSARQLPASEARAGDEKLFVYTNKGIQVRLRSTLPGSPQAKAQLVLVSLPGVVGLGQLLSTGSLSALTALPLFLFISLITWGVFKLYPVPQQ
jgi:hypothetical protein